MALTRYTDVPDLSFALREIPTFTKMGRYNAGWQTIKTILGYYNSAFYIGDTGILYLKAQTTGNPSADPDMKISLGGSFDFYRSINFNDQNLSNIQQLTGKAGTLIIDSDIDMNNKDITNLSYLSAGVGSSLQINSILKLGANLDINGNNLDVNGGTIVDSDDNIVEVNNTLNVIGDITVSGTVDGVDVSSIESDITNLQNDKLDKAGDTMGGTLDMNNNTIQDFKIQSGQPASLENGHIWRV